MDVSKLLDLVAQHFNDERHLIPMYLHLIASALFPIYTGAYASLSRPSSAAKPVKKKRRASEAADEIDDEDEEVLQKLEGMSPRDAVIYPVVAAVTLAGLYYLITKYGARAINLIFGWYFAVAGVFSVAKLVSDAAVVGISFVFPTYLGWSGKLYRVDGLKRKAVLVQGAVGESATGSSAAVTSVWLKPVYNTIWDVRAAIKQRYTVALRIGNTPDEKTNFTVIHVLATLVGIASSAYANLVAKPWYLTNLQGFAVCYTAFQMLSPTTFTTGSLLLSGLFCYDIWAVFFTPLMVTVAKNLDQPIKLVFPRPEEAVQIPFAPPKRQYSMLGLGDIVLPGIMMALALRFDLYLFYLAKQREKIVQQSDDVSGKESKGTKVENIEKAPYVPVTGYLGDRFWTARLPASARPTKLNASFPKPYFYASMVGYTIGMLTTLVVMSVYQHAQPALLYLVPGVLVSLWGTALARGEVKQMWEFSEAVDSEQVEEGGDTRKEEAGWSLDSAQTWLDMWDGLLKLTGFREGSTEATTRNGDTASEAKPDADGNAGKLEPGKKHIDSKRDDVLFRFTISRYKAEQEGDLSGASDAAKDMAGKRE
ncbi:hypothetical protein LTR91_017144 [Friedmanniomyces endolithicus]|uniref:Signal peptide peptidase n=1 Tax=Friedmanniomyces endolithicus TaxID=329885 RepID=A0A4U0UVX6_9PEZI|nr:hypothetical protein LTS09_007410 [Friedmanniomyces endolithicus]KAK0308442.1 hypothetical protein LTR01_005069 [Friedmanniomyces endolithicus]KAK0326311.1 hypothetical protein LTR82_003058 [Friedmanniomyces endolithicus]KAK0829326.1 hypothetical protein LTR73_004270 [Friedmanniomyces endolithicus]KAK0967419.1 hypothetical protein LTR91_017144 [Friedmanniomyces endolithicus]